MTQETFNEIAENIRIERDKETEALIEFLAQYVITKK